MTDLVTRKRNDVTRWLERVDGRFMGAPIKVDPHDAILHALYVTRGEVAYCEAQIARLSDEELFEIPVKETWTELPSGRFAPTEVHFDEEVVSRWVQLRDGAIERMAKYARMAAEMGVEERQIKLAESQAKMLGNWLERVFDEMHLTAEQYRMLGPAMRKHLPELIEGEARPVAA